MNVIAPPSLSLSLSAVEYNGQIYIFGGFNGVREVHYNDLHCLDPSEEQ